MGCVVLVGGEEDPGVEVAFVAIGLLHFAEGETLGGGRGDVAGFEVGGFGEVGLGEGWLRVEGDGVEVVDVAGGDGGGEVDGVVEEILAGRGISGSGGVDCEVAGVLVGVVDAGLDGAGGFRDVEVLAVESGLRFS